MKTTATELFLSVTTSQQDAQEAIHAQVERLPPVKLRKPAPLKKDKFKHRFTVAYDGE